MAKRGVLSNLTIGEIAFCFEGMNPEADMVLYKRRGDRVTKTPKRKRIAKENDEPGDFADHFEASRLMEIDEGLDRRLYALLHTTTEIMRADIDDREGRIIAAVDAYAETMKRDVPELFAGRLAKMLSAWAAEGPPSDDDVHRVVKAEIEIAGLTGEESEGDTMEFLTKLSKAARGALDAVLGATGIEDFLKGVSEEHGALIVGLAERAVAASTAEGELAKTVEELSKVRAESGTDEDFEKILKTITDPNARQLIEMQRVALSKSTGEISELSKAAETRELEDVVKSLECLPNADGELVEMLRKAKGAGFLDGLKKTLDAANTQAKKGKALEEIGGDPLLGDAVPGNADEAHEALLAKAVEICKADPSISKEKGYEMACETNPALYVATRKYVQPTQH